MSPKRENFESDELASCLSHYDIGTVQKIEEFPRGSRRAPKMLIQTNQGEFVFKRRARGKDELNKVKFNHQIQKQLAEKNFPLPHLIETKEDRNSMLILGERVYEMFEYIPGRSYENSLKTTADAGRMLGQYHKILENFNSDFISPIGSYHNAAAITKAIKATVISLPLDSRPCAKTLTHTIKFLEEAYSLCANKVEEAGLNHLPAQVVHGDWHPGNLLYRDDKVVAVIDFDAARMQQRIIDVANGALQFSIIGGDNCPSQWPENTDEERFKTFLNTYDSLNIISTMELKIIPYLMCEALIAESVLPIAATGSFGRLNGFEFLRMIERKVRWILKNIKELRKAIH